MFIEIEQKSGRIYILIFIFRALDLTNSLETFLLIALPAAVGIVAGLLTLETNNTREVSAGSSWLVLLKVLRVRRRNQLLRGVIKELT